MPKKVDTVTIYRSSITGKFISPAAAKRHPRTSIKQRIPRRKRRR